MQPLNWRLCKMPEKINRIGQTFGNLKILEQKIENKINYSLCECALCGRKKWIRTDNVVSKNTNSCGCIRKEANARIGEVHGGLVINGIVKEKGNTKAVCECIKCRKERKYSLNWIIKNNPSSCGCERKNNIKGMRFGFLEPIKPTEEREGSSVIWECVCHNCDKICYVSHAAMTQRGKESCGCYTHTKKSENGKNTFEKAIGMGMIEGTNVLSLINNNPYKTSNTGVRGVTLDRGRYVARITFKGKSYYLGRFLHLEDAEKARKSAKKNIYGDFLKWYSEEFPQKWKKIKKKDKEKNC